MPNQQKATWGRAQQQKDEATAKPWLQQMQRQQHSHSSRHHC